ncbi:MAG: pullulanase-type alpha-1,6-glucosidase [bacterium]|nr:pullulanase-type alpha-1,6-glucosidase [bacterium]
MTKRFLKSTLHALRSRRAWRGVSVLVLIALLGFSVSGFAQDAEPPALVVIAGTIQSVLGCPGDWQPDCEVTALQYDPDDDLWQATFDLPAGSYEYKVALNGTWDVNYGLNAEAGGANIPLEVAEAVSVKFVYSTATNWVTDSVNGIIANVPGSFQSEIGCPGDWQPDCLRSLLQDPDGDGIYVYSVASLPPGAYEAKVALNESWTLNYGQDGAQDGANIPFTVNEDNETVLFAFDTSTNIMTVQVGDGAAAAGNLFTARAHWVAADTVAWNIDAPADAVYALHYSPTAELVLAPEGISGGESIPLTLNEAGLPEAVLAKFPHLAGSAAFTLGEDDLAAVPDALRGQLAVSATSADGTLINATSLQIPGVLDDLFTYEGELGATLDQDGVPTLRVWAPTAQNVRLHLFADADPATESTVSDMAYDEASGVWSVTGDVDWLNQFYLYEVIVYAPSTRLIETNLVTDPYSFSLSTNSARSQIVDLDDPALMPEGWLETAKPELNAPEDIVLYELHVRDFSIEDESVTPENRGTFRAFTEVESNGMQHLRALAEAGLTHIHLLPAFDFATTNEIAAEREEIDPRWLALLPPDSDQQQTLVETFRNTDGFNWGYDPLHYTVPEGSYSTDPNGTQRILEFREMVQTLNESGLRVVMDVVYNHTNAAGQSERAVLDRIVPGYYHRLNASGNVETSTCCPNTATEHAMMQKLMVDSVRTWATAYRVDGFRFDLMGHHLVENMVEVREMLDALTLDADGVDGEAIYVYGEGWNFGEVADNARGINATQLNLGGTGIGTFNDRLRDSVRGGNPFGDWQAQGFATGLLVDMNEIETRARSLTRRQLNLFQDRIRIGLAGNLRDYALINAEGDPVTGADIDYNGSPTGYTLDPQEHIVYVSAHDNETIFDAIQLKAPLTSTPADRVRMQNLALDTVLLSQGVPFIHAGDDILRSKSLDRNSYDSGDWYNSIDWTYQSNNWGIGLPPNWNNRDNWALHAPLLANPNLSVTETEIRAANAHVREMLQIRFSSPLFRLRNAAQIIERVTFPDAGEDQQPGVIVMDLNDQVALDVDANYERIVVIFNADPEPITFTHADYAAMGFVLHPLLADSSDPIVREAAFDAGTFTVPGRTTAVFVLPEGE